MEDTNIQRVKVTQMTAILANAATLNNFLPSNPRRAYLYLQNNGLNAVAFRFGQPSKATATQPNGDIILGAGSEREYIQQVPFDSLNFGSPFGASNVTVLEGLPLDTNIRRVG